jgi:1-acyl-sn-glycerol-3-phosphate acyltransferase
MGYKSRVSDETPDAPRTPSVERGTGSTALSRQGRPPKLPRDQLRGLERLSIPLGDAINSIGWIKNIIQVFGRYISTGWITLVTRNLLELHDIEPLQTLKPPRGVILVANHRTFWDMFVASAVLYRHVPWMQRIVFPVRAKFFYTNVFGVLLNASIAVFSMWPPVFRDERKPLLNPTSVQQMSWVLARKGTVLGMHPEGTRNKGDDPYTFLSSKPGVGYLIKDAHPDTLIVPYFLNGMSNDIAGEIRRNFRKEGERGESFRFWWGSPIRVGDLDRSKPARDLASDILLVIGELAERDRAHQIEAGALPDPPLDSASAS